MEYVIGALLLASFFGLAVYAVRGGNLMIGMLIIGTLWTVLPLFGNTFATNPDFIAAYPGVTDISFVDAITKVYQSGPEGWGSVLVNVVFGAWFGRVLLETGIADALIRKTVELGGDKPIVISVLLSIVTTAIFSTLFGAGAVVAIGVIILPILMSLGIPKVLAVGSFMMSVGAGMYLNPVLSGQFLAFFLDENGKQLITYDDPARLRWAVIGMLVQLGMVIVMTAVSLRKKKTVHAWGASAARRARPGYVPTKALIAPILPVLLLVIFKVPIILGFTLASLYAMLVCGKMKSFRGVCRTINKDFYESLEGQDKEWFDEASEHFVQNLTQLIRDAQEGYIQLLKDNGINVVEVTSEQKDAFIESAASVYDLFIEKYGGTQELIDLAMKYNDDF